MKKGLLILIIVLAVIAIIGFIVWWFVLGGGPYTPPEESADERFGFLSSPMPDDLKWIREVGAAWARPHPGPFIWGRTQWGPHGDIDFNETDEVVKNTAKYDLNLLVTLWPYADWDQENHPAEKNCLIEGDEFSNEFGDYRCNPYDWTAYTDWVEAMVERYDGDGQGDMPNLEQPVKYWEVFNEPDLQGMPGEPFSLTFYVEDPADYAELLKKTYQTIKSADPESKVLIAGAAGGHEFLDFYRELFADAEVQNNFDIGNVHCISNDDYESFNVEPYLEMLDEFGINKPVWVTEAEAFVSTDSVVNATQLKASTAKALELGAQKIFYTSREAAPVKDFMKEPGFQDTIEPDPELDVDSSEELYQKIFESL